jgi:hypothetical protein
MLVPLGNFTYLYSCLIDRGIIIVAIDNSNARGKSLINLHLDRASGSW